MRYRPESKSQRKRAHEAALQLMADEGLITPALRKGPMPSLRWRSLKIKGKPLSQSIIEDREDRA